MEERLRNLEKSIETVFDAVFEIDVQNNSVSDIFIKKDTFIYKGFPNNKMSYSRFCRLIITEVADSADIEVLTEFLNPTRIKKVRLDKGGENEERLQFRVRNQNAVLWKECRLVYYRNDPSAKELCTFRDITYEKNYELKYNAQSELINATAKSEREIMKVFLNALNAVCDSVNELNYTTLECFEYDFSNDDFRKKSMSSDLKEHIRYLAQNEIYKGDVQNFLNLFSIGNIVGLAEKRIESIDTKLRLRNGNNYEWYALSGILSRNENNEIILTVFIKNIDKSETEIINKRNALEASLTEAGERLKSAEQFKNAFVKSSYFWLSASVDKDLIKDDFIDVNGNSLLKTVGLSAPCKLSEFSKRWMDRYVIKIENASTDSGIFMLENMKKSYENGNRFYKGRYKAISTTGRIIWLECYTMLMRTEIENELIMLHYALDITDEKRKNDNYKSN